MEICGDSEGAKTIVNNPSSASRSKHIDVKLHFIRGLMCAGKVSIVRVGTEEQNADVLTKPLWRKKFLVHRAALMSLLEIAPLVCAKVGYPGIFSAENIFFVGWS